MTYDHGKVPLLRSLVLALCVPALLFPQSALAGRAEQEECGGEVVCECGDRVVEDYTMTEPLGPCVWDETEPSDELIGLRVDSDVVLDCAGHSIQGPADAQKEEFGIKVGSGSREVSGAVVQNCVVRGFWWGIYVTNSVDILIQDNVAEENGWFDPRQNGTGYGMDIANSRRVEVRNNLIRRNGNEGLHLSSSNNVLIENNTLEDNGFEQIYIINADHNEIRGNSTYGGRQGLELRDADDNSFSYNFWRGADLHWLENDGDRNTFVYDHFEGMLRISDHSNDNRFENCSFFAPGGDCVWSQATGNRLIRPFFAACKRDVYTKSPITVERSAAANKMRRKKQILDVLPGCSADMNGDGLVDEADRSTIEAALGSAPGESHWNPDGDLDHDGLISSVDLDVFEAQEGSCDDIRNSLPRAGLRRKIIEKGPTGSGGTVRIDASKATDDEDRLVSVDLYIENLATGEGVLRVQRPAGDDAVLEEQLPRGKYMIYATAMDRFGATSDPKRRGVILR